MSEIQHNRETVDALINKMIEVTAKNEQVEATLTNLAKVIQSEFAGEAKESLDILLTNEIKKIKDEKANWQKLIERAQSTADSMEEHDETLATGGGGWR